jgi:inner membrane protein
LTIVAGVGVASHIFLDWITSWGTMFLSPLSWHRYALDWVFILDGPLSGLLLCGVLGLLVLGRRPARTRVAARLALVASALYVGLCARRHHEAMEVLRRLEPPGTLVRAAIPQPLSPDRWLLLADDGTDVHASFVDLSRHGKEPLPPLPDSELESITPSLAGLGRLVARLDSVYRSPDDPGTRRIPKADGPFAQRTLDEGRSGIFGRFARFPAARERREPDGRTTVVLRDVRFGYLAPAVDPFTYLVTYETGGHIAFAGFPSRRWSDDSRGGAVPASP